MAEFKGFKASKRKLDKARKEGNTLKSQLFTQTLVLCATVGSAIILVEQTWVRNQMLLEYYLTSRPDVLVGTARNACRFLLFFVVICLAIGASAALVAESLQVGIKFESDAIKLKAQRLNVVSGLKRSFAGLKNIWQFLVRIALMLIGFCWFFEVLLAKFTELVIGGSLTSLVALSWSRRLLVVGIAVLVILAGLEYLVRRRNFIAELSMSADDIRREFKEDEGDAMLKAVRKFEHEQLIRQEIIRRIRSSRVIIVDKG